jgi:hypothetical protein
LAQVVEYLPSRYEVLNTNPVLPQKNKPTNKNGSKWVYLLRENLNPVSLWKAHNTATQLQDKEVLSLGDSGMANETAGAEPLISG